MLVSLFNKVTGSQACIFIKKRLQHRCFPVKFAKFLKTPFFTEHFQGLLLFMYKPEKIHESEECKILWCFSIDKQLKDNRTDITVTDKINKIYQLIDPLCPFYSRTKKKEEKCTNYCDLKFEIIRIWNMKKGRTYTSCYWSIRDSLKGLQQMDKKIRIRSNS